MSRLGLVAACFAALACGPATNGQNQQQFQLQLASDHVDLEAGQSVLIELMVIGTAGRPVSITSPDLPSFAVLVGNELRIVTARADRGSYPITLVATSGADSSSTVLMVNVAWTNSPPTWDVTAMSGLWDFGYLKLFCGDISHPCRFDHIPYFSFSGLDADGDAIVCDLELVEIDAAGTPHFTGQPTLTLTTAASDVFFDTAATGKPYALALRLRDSLGSTWTQFAGTTRDLGNGWVSWGAFRFGPPMSDDACIAAGELPGAFCGAPSDCCSDKCSNNWQCI